MTRFLIIALSVILFVSRTDASSCCECDPTTAPPTEATTAAPECSDGKVLVDCPVDCPSDYCPKSRYDDQSSCPTPADCPPAQCKCGFNSRLHNGTCIPTRDCPPFECNGVNEEYNSCPPYCPGVNCSEATADGKCHIFGRIGIVLICKPACRCKSGYWRLDGVCVSYAECLAAREETTPSSSDDVTTDSSSTSVSY
nr:Zon2-L [Andraca theae]